VLSKQKTLYVGLLILIGSFTLRFLNLGDIPGPTFDEVFYPRYGFNYLTGDNFYYVHPPLANYLYAAAIWIYNHLPWINTVAIDTIPFEELNPLSYRWLNALLGSLLCLVAYFFAYAIWNNRNFALIVCLFVAIDGSLLVDSRFALANIFIVFFGLSALLCVAKSQSADVNSRYWLLSCGIFLGLVISVKWNGLGYMLVILSFFLAFYCTKLFDVYELRFTQTQINRLRTQKTIGSNQHKIEFKNPVSQLEYLIYLIAVPLLVYLVIYIPDLQFNTQYGFLEKHQQQMGFHQIMVEENEHPYCSKWYSWPFMIRPIGYFFNATDTLDVFGNKIVMFQDVHLFPNPYLYWFSAVAILTMAAEWIKLFWRWINQGIVSNKFYLFMFILLGYFANLLPWALVSRCVFLYQYQPASVFAFLALAWYLAKYIKSESLKYRVLSWGILAIVFISFLYWLPIQLGISLDSDAFYDRMWFPSWI